MSFRYGSRTVFEARPDHLREPADLPGTCLTRESDADLPLCAKTQRVPGIGPIVYVVLEIRDEGSGTHSDDQTGLFEPFFTANAAKGSIGLAATYGAIRKSGGYIWAASELGRGSTFRLYLPQGSQPEE